ncbi:hypothetical protein OCF84_20645 (plasmid) [Shewanella xiamenensis]|uniref:Uncharacterized protein n=1 Tax=Shewanella xiamenensis TaxID=332186 RepID=A0ABT6UIH4_9GAMM|nr:hypothetical protein [Shewanella xiamenensis]MDI5833321.1 hypothetical protein [Shewanella xiamenensis]WHF57927.1 hypothetical protein OCF84_20645 [Shewanella xiamenensis]
MAKVKVNLGALEDNWDAIIDLNLDTIANAKVLLNKPEFSKARKLLTIATFTSMTLGAGFFAADAGAKIMMMVEGFNYTPTNSVAMMLSELSNAGALKIGALASTATAAATGMMANVQKLVDVIDKYLTKHNPELESARVAKLAEAYGEIFNLISEETNSRGFHNIDEAFERIRPVSDSLGLKSQKQMDSIVYGWMSREFNENMSPDDPDMPAIIGKRK